MRGRCAGCGCKIECAKDETKECIDRDTQPGMATRYVKCPECHKDFLWVK
jgi:hypothetical protein